MALDTLLEKLQDESVTSVTACNVIGVTRRPASTLACTPVTDVTSQITNSQIKKKFDDLISNAIPTKENKPITRAQEAILKNWLTEIGEPSSEHYLVINKCRNDPEAMEYFLKQAGEHARNKRYQKVLSMLIDSPGIQRASSTNVEDDPHHVIVTIAVRGSGICELRIEKSKYDPFAILTAIENGGLQ